MPEIEYAFLADAVDARPGEKFNVLGGGVFRLTGPMFPFQHPHLALVVGLRMTSIERGREHDLEFVVTSPAGEQLGTASGKVVAHGPAIDPNDVVVTLGIDFWNLALPVPGEYGIRIVVDGSERKRIPLLVAQARAGMPEQRYLA